MSEQPALLALLFLIVAVLAVRGIPALSRRIRKRRAVRRPPDFSNTAGFADALAAQRSRAVEEARAQQEVIDGVFGLALFLRHGPSEGLFALAEEAFPSHPSDHLRQLCNLSQALLSAASGHGDELLDAKFANFDAVLEQVRSAHPGFSASTYSAALNHACMLAR